MRRWLILAFFATVLAIGAGTALYLVFSSPRMRRQPHFRAYEASMPLAPEGAVGRYPWPEIGQPKAGGEAPLTLEEKIERGRVYYEYYCTFCHGSDGRGSGPVGESCAPAPADLRSDRIRQMSDGDLERTMLTGIGHAPVLERVVSREHRELLVRYVRQLGQEPK